MMQDKDCSVLVRGIIGWERDSTSVFKLFWQESCWVRILVSELTDMLHEEGAMLVFGKRQPRVGC